MSELIKAKTGELEGAALDWAVAQIDPMCEGLKWMRVEESPLWAGFAEIDGESTICAHLSERYSPSTDWSRGGPLIEQHGLCVGIDDTSEERLSYWAFKDIDGYDAKGSTVLIAAMRAIVSSELGDTVEVPKELVT